MRAACCRPTFCVVLVSTWRRSLELPERARVMPRLVSGVPRRALVALAALAIPAACLAAQPERSPDPLGKVKQAIRLKQFKEAQSQLQQLAGGGNADAQY